MHAQQEFQSTALSADEMGICFRFSEAEIGPVSFGKRALFMHLSVTWKKDKAQLAEEYLIFSDSVVA